MAIIWFIWIANGEIKLEERLSQQWFWNFCQRNGVYIISQVDWLSFTYESAVLRLDLFKLRALSNTSFALSFKAFAYLKFCFWIRSMWDNFSSLSLPGDCLCKRKYNYYFRTLGNCHLSVFRIELLVIFYISNAWGGKHLRFIEHLVKFWNWLNSYRHSGNEECMLYRFVELGVLYLRLTRNVVLSRPAFRSMWLMDIAEPIGQLASLSLPLWAFALFSWHLSSRGC